MDRDKFTNPDLCRSCQGSCCKASPGLYAPQDFSIDLDPQMIKRKLTELFIAYAAVIDYWSDAEVGTIYFVRPSSDFEQGARRINTSFMAFGPCHRLTETGCNLAFNQRPFQCRALIPSQDDSGEYNCHYPTDAYDKLAVAKRWAPFEDQIFAASAAADIILSTIAEHQPTSGGKTK